MERVHLEGQRGFVKSLPQLLSGHCPEPEFKEKLLAWAEGERSLRGDHGTEDSPRGSGSI